MHENGEAMESHASRALVLYLEQFPKLGLLVLMALHHGNPLKEENPCLSLYVGLAYQIASFLEDSGRDLKEWIYSDDLGKLVEQCLFCDPKLAAHGNPIKAIEHLRWYLFLYIYKPHLN